MTLQSETGEPGGDRESHARETPARSRRPDVGIAAAALLGDLVRDGRRPLDRLRTLRELRQVLDEFEAIDAEQAVREHRRFEDIGAALGLSKSAAHRRFAHLRPPRYRW